MRKEDHPLQIRAFASRIRDEVGSIDCLINNAGVFEPQLELSEVSRPTRWLRNSR